MARAIRRQRRQLVDGEDESSHHSDHSSGSTSSVQHHVVEAVSTEDPRDLPIHRTNIPRVACAILASITTGGTTYAFGIYGGALKKRLHLTQSQLDTISAVFFSAGLLSFIPGAMADRFGTRNGICIGGITGATSLMAFWGVAKGFVPIVTAQDDPTFAVTVLSILSAMIFLSCALVTGSVFKVISCQCGPGSKGSAVGVAKGFVGLGSGAYACLFQSIQRPETSELDFLPLCAFFFVTAACIPSWWGLPNKANETFVPDVLTPLHFRVLYASLATLAVLIIGNSLLRLYQDSHPDNNSNKNSEPNWFMVALLLFVWIAPIVSLFYLPQKTDYESEPIMQPPLRRPENEDSSEHDYEQMTTLLESEHHHNDDSETSTGISLEALPTDEGSSRSSRSSSGSSSDDDDDEESSDDSMRGTTTTTRRRRKNKNLFEMLQTPSAWMMLWVTTILTGGGTVETNNLGQMVESLGFNPVVTPATVALFSVAQSGGRVITGALSESALGYDTQKCCIEKGVPRPFFFVAASLAAVLAHTILAVATDQVFFVIGITLSGVAFGMIWPLMVLCVGEFYGTVHVGANYMFYDGFTSAAGTFLLSKVVAQEVYESHIHGNEKEDVTTCYGIECFQTTHLVIVLLSLTCVVVSVLMQYQTRTVYSTSS